MSPHNDLESYSESTLCYVAEWEANAHAYRLESAEDYADWHNAMGFLQTMIDITRIPTV